MTQIAVMNESTVMSDGDVQKMLAAFDQQWNTDLRPVWGVDAATFTFVPKHQMPAARSWWLVFLDNSDQAGALADQDLTNEAVPVSKLFVDTLDPHHGWVQVSGSAAKMGHQAHAAGGSRRERRSRMSERLQRSAVHGG